MVATGIGKIDSLWSDPLTRPLAPGDPDAEAVGAIQDLLIGHGAPMPGILGASRGVYGPQTVAAISAFQESRGQPPTGTVDSLTLHRLVEEIAPSPIAARGYLALVLDRSWDGYPRLVALTAQFEAAGNFAAHNRNSDRAGLSFGIIQWAQKPGRLNEILRAFQLAQPGRFVEVFGGGDARVSSGLLAHTAKPNGGVDELGQTSDPAFDLIDEIWGPRFIAAGRDRVWQKAQIDEAVTAFRHSCTTIRVCAPLAQSERALAFLLDVANQHGSGGSAISAARLRRRVSPSSRCLRRSRSNRFDALQLSLARAALKLDPPKRGANVFEPLRSYRTLDSKRQPEPHCRPTLLGCAAKIAEVPVATEGIRSVLWRRPENRVDTGYDAHGGEL
jgi:peptidoglycan hydrolase-like protein with peptidoglycan-binding domain